MCDAEQRRCDRSRATMMSTSPIDIVRTIDDGFSRNDARTVLAVCEPDAVMAQDLVVPWGGRFSGKVAVTEFVTRQLTIIDSSVEAGQLFEAGDRVMRDGRSRRKIRAVGASFDTAGCDPPAISGGLVWSGEFLIDTPAMFAACGGRGSRN